MSGPRPAPQGDDTPLNPPDLEQQDEQVFYRRQEEVEDSDREFNDVAQYEGEPAISPTGNDAMRFEDLADSELREGETFDPDVAAEEGLTWVPPVDPPIVPDLDDPQGAKVAAGFGTPDDDPFDRRHQAELLTAEDDTDARVREALLADATTTAYADTLVIGSRDGTIVVRGMVDDIDDTDNIVDVITRVTGVDEVIDELEVRGVTD